MLGEMQAQVNRALEEASAETSTGTCVGYDWSNFLVRVNIGGSELMMPWAGDSPWRGGRVRVLWVGGQPVAVAVHGSAMGTVLSVASSIATVTGDDARTYVYPVATGLTVSAGHRVRLDHAGRLVSVRYAAEPPGSEFEVPAAPPVVGGSATFVPTQSGSWKLGAFRGPDVEVNGDDRSGFYWYGTQIADTLPSGAVITRAELRLSELYDYYPGTAAPLGTHTQASVSGSAPALSGAIPVTDGPVVNIASIAGNFLSGHLGVGFASGAGQRAFAPAPGSGSIYIEWQ